MAENIRAGYLAPYDSFENRIANLKFVQDIPMEPSVPSYSVMQYIEDNLKQLCNLDTFELEKLEIEEDIDELKLLIENHSVYTDSDVAKRILKNWDIELKAFKKVMPTDYKRVLLEQDRKEKKAG